MTIPITHYFYGITVEQFNEMPDWLQEVVIGGDYQHVKKLADGEYAGLSRFAFTWAILSGINHCGYEDRWCYHSFELAKVAFDKWDGTAEPEGWHRHPRTGRRRDIDGTEYINF